MKQVKKQSSAKSKASGRELAATPKRRAAHHGKSKLSKKSNDDDDESCMVEPGKEARTPKRKGHHGKSKLSKKSDDDGGSCMVEPGKEARTPKRKRAKSAANKTRTENDADHQANTVLRQFALATVQKGVQGLLNEFTELNAATTAFSPVKTAFDANPDKNRYTDVYCMDNTRVVLTWPQGSTNNYIHANNVSIQGQRKFICTQGPTEKTVDDFWRMIWQEKVQGIVMLCRLFEEGKKKCEAYYPETQDGILTTTSNIKIKNIGIVDSEKILTVTTLELSAEDKTITLKHFLWNAWPDRGVPKNVMATLRLLAQVKNISPVVVHCSAGIGRTGTIVGLQLAQNTILNGETLNMANVVKELRSQRFGAVQADNQYIYMHRVMLGLAENKKTVNRNELTPFLNEYEAFLKSRGF